MGIIFRRFCIPFLYLIIIIEAKDSDVNDTSTNETRQARATGRIVKLYSGPKPEPIICADEGFQKDPHNCAIFYRCTRSGNGKYTVYRFQCGPGTIYDPDIQVCNHARSTRRSECGGLLQPIEHTTHINEIENMHNEIPSPIITNKPTYTESTAPTTTFTLSRPAESTYFTTKREVTTTSSSPDVWGSPIYNNPMGYPMISASITTKPIVTSSHDVFTITSSTTSEISHSSSRDNTCTSDGFIGDTENCRKFYRCVANQRGGYTRYEFTCTETTIWDDDSQICNHVWAVKRSRCGRRSEIDKNTQNTNKKEYIQDTINHNLHKEVTEKSIQQQLQISYGSKVRQSQTQISNGAVVQNQTQIHYGDRINQDKYRNKQNQTQLSRDGSATSQSQTQIDYGSKGIQTQLQIDHSKKASQSQVQISESSTRTSSTSTRHVYSEELQKKNDCTQPGFVGDTSDCKKFYRCVDNGHGGYAKYEFSCGQGTAWDQSIGACNHEWAVKDCGSKPYTESTTRSTTNTYTSTYKTTQGYISSTTTEKLSTGFVDIEDTEDNGYGKPQPEHIPTPSSTTTAASSTIDYSNDGECTSSGFMGDNNDCNIFYRCVENGNGGYIKHKFRCGEGTVWDSEIEACNHAWAVTNCGSNSNTTQPLNHVPLPVLPVLGDIQDYETISDQPLYNEISNDNPVITQSTTDATQESSHDMTCMKSGFFGDKNDCKKFYRCVDDGNNGFTRYEYVCSDGTVWDETIDACNHDWAVKSCESTANATTQKPSQSASTNPVTIAPTHPPTTEDTSNVICAENASSVICSQEGFINDPNNCKTFYRCVSDGNGGFIKYEFNCGEGTYWNQDILSCDYVTSDKECEKKASSSTTKRPQHENDQIYTETTTSYKDEGYLTQKPSATSEVCTSEGFYGDPNDCKKFYRCVDDGKGTYIKYDFICGDGTAWDQSLQTCNHETDKCATSSHTTMSTTTEKKETSTFSDNTTTCTSEGFFAVPNNCKKFLRCVKDDKGGFTKFEFTCAEGTVWVQEMLTCSQDTGEAYCKSHSAAAPVTSENSQDHTERYEQSTSDNKYNNSHVEPSPSTENNVCSSEGYFANKNDCRQFYRCVNNEQGNFTKYDFTCSEGTAWDTSIQTCNYIDKVSSCQGSILHSEESNQAQTTQNIVSSSQTSSSMTTTTQKPIDNSKPNSESSTQTSLHSTDSCTSEGYFGNAQDCRMFYRCVSNGQGSFTKYDFVCAEGTIWDPDLTTCNHPENVVNPTCNQTAINEESSGNSSSDGNTITESSTQRQENTSKQPQNNEVNCTEAGFYPNPNDCKKFYRCVDWEGDGTKLSVFHFDCAEGTIWDPALTTCNHEESVYPPRTCNGTQSANVNQSSTTQASTTIEEGSTTASTTESTTQSTTESTTQSTTESTTQSTTESTTQSTTESTTQSTTESTTQPTTESTTQSTTESTTQSTNESTTQSTTESTTQSTTESTTQSTTESTTQSTTESTTQSTTESTTQSTTESTTQSTTESTTQSTTESTTQSTTESTTQSTTESTTESTTQSTTESTTPSSSESTTESITESTTQSTTQSTTESTTPSTTESTTQSTTESTTQSPAQSTTQAITESTTGMPEETTTSTESPTTTTSKPVGENTEPTTQSTTEQVTQETTEKTEQTTAGTTERPGESTTEQSSEGTTQSATTDKYPSEKECPETDEDQYLFVCPSSFRRHPKYCNLFYQCDEDEKSHDLKIAVFTCPNNTIYDETQIKCVEESKASEPCNGQIAQSRRVKRKNERIAEKEPIVVTEDSYACPNAGPFSFERDSECSQVFLKCTRNKSNKLRGFVYQCPKGFLYWSVSRRCEPTHRVKDCRRSVLNDWSRRWEIPIESKNVAWR